MDLKELEDFYVKYRILDKGDHLLVHVQECDFTDDISEDTDTDEPSR